MFCHLPEQFFAQEETDAGVALFNNTKPSKVKLHYDTTSRSNTNGEWSSLII